MVAFNGPEIVVVKHPWYLFLGKDGCVASVKNTWEQFPHPRYPAYTLPSFDPGHTKWQALFLCPTPCKVMSQASREYPAKCILSFKILSLSSLVPPVTQIDLL